MAQYSLSDAIGFGYSLIFGLFDYPEHFDGCCVGEPLTMVVGMQHEPDLALLVLHTEPDQIDVPDQGAGAALRDRQRQRVAFGFEGTITSAVRPRSCKTGVLVPGA